MRARGTREADHSKRERYPLAWPVALSEELPRLAVTRRAARDAAKSNDPTVARQDQPLSRRRIQCQWYEWSDCGHSRWRRASETPRDHRALGLDWGSDAESPLDNHLLSSVPDTLKYPARKRR